MALIVQKYGGTSVANLERIQNVATRVAKTFDKGNDVVVILSAMAGITDELINMASNISQRPINASSMCCWQPGSRQPPLCWP